MIKEIKIPDIAENVETGLVAGILVAEGDEVSADQPLFEIETDKATTEIPSEDDGVVKEIRVEEGDEVKVNQVILILEVQNGEEKSEPSDEEEKTGSGKKDKSAKQAEKNEDDDTSENRREQEEEGNEKSRKGEEDRSEDSGDDQGSGSSRKTGTEKIPVSPLARKIARENDVNLNEVDGSGPGGRISRSDVEAFIRDGKQEAESSKEKERKGSAAGRREKLSQIDKITAQTMSKAWQTIPQVTQFDEADVTGLEEFRKANMDRVQKAGGKLTLTAMLLKISAFALQKFERFNSSLDWENKEIEYKDNYDIGVAVDTPHGLLVPVIRDVHRKSLTEISVELSEVAAKARDKKLSNEDMQGGNFTITNLGGIGGTQFTPIVYPPQVAILGVSRAAFRQVWKDDEFSKRLVLPLSLSYDHRVINGADGARFLRWVCGCLEDPYALLF